MKKEELNRIIGLLETSNAKEEAYMAFYQFGGGPDESFAKANQGGLELFAAQLLKASRDMEEAIHDNKKEIPLDTEDWIDGDILIQYIEPTDTSKNQVAEDISRAGFFDKLIHFGYVSGLILILVAAVIGIITIIKWIF